MNHLCKVSIVSNVILTSYLVKKKAYEYVKSDIDYAYFNGIHPKDKKELIAQFPKNWTNYDEAMILQEHWDALYENDSGADFYVGNYVKFLFNENEDARRINFNHWSYKIIESLPDPSISCVLVKGQPCMNDEIEKDPDTYTPNEFINKFMFNQKK